MRRLFKLFLESLSGEERDYAAMGIRRAIVLLSIPMIMEMGMEALFALVDTFFVSKLGDVATAILALRIISCGYFFYGYGMVLAQAFNGAGDSLTPTWLNAICFWAIEIPLAYVIAIALGLGPAGVFASVAISESILAVLSGLLFQRGRWKAVKV